ncbi:MAG: DUF547 domain-containing protein [Opitutaceae bacterium]
MKTIALLFGLLMSVAFAHAEKSHEVDYTSYAELLSSYVKEDGVAYAAWFKHKADLQKLDSVLGSWAKLDVGSLSKDAQKAFYINLYNAGMLQAVFKNYPLKSVKDIGLIPFSIFKKDFIYQGGRTLSLDDVEKGILLKDSFDSRIHFAVNCASESCPPLRAEPFVGAKLEQQLDEQTRLFANSKRAARIDTKQKSIAYSELFNWYAKDFAGEHPAKYLNKYRSQQLPMNYQQTWIAYDWSLNALN